MQEKMKHIDLSEEELEKIERNFVERLCGFVERLIGSPKDDKPNNLKDLKKNPK